jgi:mRNA m6A methyltransferase catalytic subunit
MNRDANGSAVDHLHNDTDEALGDAPLRALLEREVDLLLQAEELTAEIHQIRTQLVGPEGSGRVEAGTGDDEYRAPQWCIPVRADVLKFDWAALAATCQFDVISMDPPWQLASHAPTRGVAITYQQLPDALIQGLPIPLLQGPGAFLFLWVINNKYVKGFELLEHWGYTYVDDVTWVKQTVNRRMAKGHGYYLQHAKETCLVGRKGRPEEWPVESADAPRVPRDVIYSARRGQSQKPDELYDMMETLVPGGRYLEIFGRKNNLRDYWMTVGNEL